MVNSIFYEEEILDRMMSLVSPKTGIIGGINIKNTIIHKNNSYNDSFYEMYLSNTISNYNKKFDFFHGGGGASISKNQSLIKAIGEHIERYSAVIENSPDTYSNINELISKNEPYLDIRDILLFSNEQYNDPKFPYYRYESNQNLYWVKGFNLNNKNELLIPAQKVYLFYQKNKVEKEYDTRLSTGLACGDSLESSILSGIYECIERDSFYITWMCKIPGKKINMDSITNNDLYKLYNSMKSSVKNNLYLIDMTLDTKIHSILCVLISNDNGIGLNVCASANLDPELAVLKALEELLLCNTYAYSDLSDNLNGIYPEINKDEINELDDHSRYYYNPINNESVNFIIENDEWINLSDMKNYSSNDKLLDLNFCVEELENIGMNSYYIDITKDELENTGFKVVKVLVPGLANIDVSYNARNIGCKRFKKFLGDKALNLDPHPFP